MELVDRLVADVPAIPSIEAFTDRVAAELANLADADVRLLYLLFLGDDLSTPDIRRRFSPEEIIALTANMASHVDALTAFVTPQGLQRKEPVDIFNLTQSLVVAAHEQELLLLTEGMLDQKLSAQIAEVRFVHARRGQLFYALQQRSDRNSERHCPPSHIVLGLLDLARRFRTIGQSERARDALTFLWDLRDPLKIPKHAEEAWALADFSLSLNANLKMLRNSLKDTEKIETLLRVHDAGISGCTRGLYSYSPQIFRENSRALRQLAETLPRGHEARGLLLSQAIEHEERAVHLQSLAARLFTASPSEEI